MRLVLCILLLAVRSQAIDTQKGWSDWLSEGQAFRDAGNYSAAARAFREALTIAERSNVSDRELVVLEDALAGAYAEARVQSRVPARTRLLPMQTFISEQ
jgi:hypothetical protein